MFAFLSGVPQEVWLFLFSLFATFICLQQIFDKKWAQRGSWDKAFWVLVLIVNVNSLVYMYWHFPS